MKPFQSILSRLRNLGRSERPEMRRAELAAPMERQVQRSTQAKLKRRYKYRAEKQLQTLARAIEAAEYYEHPDRRELMSIYEQVLDDAHLWSVYQTRKGKTLSERFVMIAEAGAVGNRFDDEAADLLRAPWFYQFLNQVLDTIFWGHSLIEFVADREGYISHSLLIWRDHVEPMISKIFWDQERGSSADFRSDAKLRRLLLEIGHPDDLGLLKKAAKYVIAKDSSLSDWLNYSEKFGTPHIVVKTTSTDDAELDRKEEFLANLGRNGYAILDEGDEYNMVSSNIQNPHQLFSNMKDSMNEEISKLVLGQTMTTEDGSSLAQGEVHERVLNTITQADMRHIAFVVNDMLFPWLAERFDRYSMLPQYRFEFYRNTEEYEQGQQSQQPDPGRATLSAQVPVALSDPEKKSPYLNAGKPTSG